MFIRVSCCCSTFSWTLYTSFCILLRAANVLLSTLNFMKYFCIELKPSGANTHCCRFTLNHHLPLPPLSCPRLVRSKLFVCHSFWGLHVTYNNLIITGYILFKLYLLATGPGHLLLCYVLLHFLLRWFNLNAVHFSENSSWSSYTGCPRRNGQNIGSVFLMLKYTDITQNTYIQSWTVTEITATEVWKYDSCYTLTDYQIHIKTGRNMWFL